MSRSAEDWHKYREIAINARSLLRDAADNLTLLLEDMRFEDQHAQVAYAEDKLYRAIENLNTAIGSVTGGWWDEDDA